MSTVKNRLVSLELASEALHEIKRSSDIAEVIDLAEEVFEYIKDSEEGTEVIRFEALKQAIILISHHSPNPQITNLFDVAEDIYEFLIEDGVDLGDPEE